MKHPAKLLIISTLSLLALSGCAADSTAPTDTGTDITVTEEVTESTEITESAADAAVTENTAVEATTVKKEEEMVLDIKTFPDNTYSEMPTGYKDNITEHGTFEEFSYTAKNTAGEEYDKRAVVYLPFGYDPDDKETKYDVLYLMHGGGDDEMRYWGSGLEDVLDAMFEKGDCKPCIVVTPNYRIPGYDETTSAKNFYKELTEYLIPAFESEYNTYAENTAPDGIKASRMHRAYGGFSMGACSAWAVFENCLDEIAFHMPVSGDCWSVSGSGEDKAQYLAGRVSEMGYTADDFFIYAGCGNTGDVAYPNMIPQLDAMKELNDTFIYCDNFADGNFYYYPYIPTGHSIETVNRTVYNALPKFFGSGDKITVHETAVTEQEMSYMEKCKEKLTEMPPEEILSEREGTAYPTFEKYTYYSQTAERDTPVNVLLPADYSEDKKYPVLYILHGYYDNEDWMARDIVHISTMLTNLTADGEAAEMIVVCPYIYCSKDMPYCTGMDTQNTLNYDNFINDMMTDLMPFIEENFPVAQGRENTAITGFSMGGRESLFIGVSHPDKFGYIGAVCAAPGLTEGTGYPWMLKEDELTFGENKPDLLLISAAEHDGVVGANPATYKALFSNNGEEYIWHSMSQTGHDHSSVTPHLYNLFRMIFHTDP